MDLDLNQEPLDSPRGSIFRLGSLLNELETAHEHIEERIRQLEAVTSRARQRQRWRQSENILQGLNSAVQLPAVEVSNDSALAGERVRVATEERTLRTRKVLKMNGIHLVAQALDMDTDATETITDNGKGGFFDCNICLVTARDPILTRCGHLFCWPCFYRLSYSQLNVRECPVCMQEITDANIIPIYGHGNDNHSQKSKLKESGLMIPPRPQAPRVESLRQQLINHRAISSVIDRNIRLFSMIFAMEESSQSRDADGSPFTAQRAGFLTNPSLTSEVSPANSTEEDQHRPFQAPRLSLQGAASFSSLSRALTSAMDSAERLVEDLQASVHSLHMTGNNQPFSDTAEIDPISNIAAAIQQDSQILTNTTSTDSVATQPSSLRLENQRTDGVVRSNNSIPMSSTSSRRRLSAVSRTLEVENSIEVNSTISHSSLLFRRRSEFPRVSDVEREQLREPRRRRLF